MNKEIGHEIEKLKKDQCMSDVENGCGCRYRDIFCQLHFRIFRKIAITYIHVLSKRITRLSSKTRPDVPHI